MNKGRRKELDAVKEMLSTINGQIESAKELLEGIMGEEQDYHDNMPESVQQGSKGEKAQEAITALQEAIDSLDGIDVDGIVECITRAQEG